MSRSLLHRRRPRPSAPHLPRLRNAPIQRPAAPTRPLKPRRGDAPTKALPRRHGRSHEGSHDEREQLEGALEVDEERVGSEDDASLRPLARALLALAEQLRREEAP
jgi:hypothetical protein